MPEFSTFRNWQRRGEQTLKQACAGHFQLLRQILDSAMQALLHLAIVWIVAVYKNNSNEFSYNRLDELIHVPIANDT